MTSLATRRRRPFATGLVLLVGLIVAGGLYAVVAPAERAQANTAQSLQIEEGRQLYLENCSTCHGLNAEGTTDGPTLIGVGAASVDFQVGTGRMPLAAPGVQAKRGPVQFTDEEISELASYIASLSPGPAIPSEEQLEISDADIQEGGELFRTNCASCHNFSGQGGALTRGKFAPSLVGVEPKHLYEAMLTGPQSMPVFSDRSLEPEEKQAIIAWLKAIEAEPNVGGAGLGRMGPVTEGLAAWIIGIGALIGVSVWIGAKAS